MKDDYANKSIDELKKAQQEAYPQIAWVYLISAIVFALLQIAYSIWEAADKTLYPGAYNDRSGRQ